MDQAYNAASLDVVGQPVLFEIQRSNSEIKLRRLFTNCIEPDTWKCYMDYFRKIICIVY